MVKILSVTLKKNKYIVETTIGEYKLNEEVLVEYFIVKGKEFEEHVFTEMLEFAELNTFYLKAINFLSFKERTYYEMEEYLIKKGLSHPESIIDRLTEKGLLNDTRYAKNFLEHSINSLKGPRYYKMELTKRRVDPNLIEDELLKYDFEREYDTLLTLFKKTLRPKAISYNKYKKQLIDKFARSGFSIYAINEVLQNHIEEMLENIDEIAALKKDFDKIKTLPKQKIITKLLQKGYNYGKIKDIVN